MRILILSTKLPYPAKDGGAIATLNLARGLANCGIEISMLCFNTSKHHFPPEQIPEEISQQIHIQTVAIDTSIKPFQAFLNLLFSNIPYIATRFRCHQYTKKLSDLLHSDHFDFIQLEGPYLYHYIPLIRKVSKGKISLRSHNVEHEIWDRRWKNERNFLLRNYFKNLAKRVRDLEKRVLKEVDILVAISEKDRMNLSAYNGKIKSIYIPTGINIAEYNPEFNEKCRDIFFIGALDWAPNQEGLRWFLNEVIPHLATHDIRLHIAGRNAAEDFLTDFTHPLLVYHGEVEDALEFMRSYHVMVVPLLTGSGMRIKILEGMALGKCIVTTSIGAEGIPAKDEFNIFIADEGKLFATKILSIINDSGMAASVSREARKMVRENFDNFVISSRLRDFYTELA